MFYRTDVLLGAVLLAAVGSCAPQYGRTPFRCAADGDAATSCPSGFRCVSQLCVANDQPASQQLSDELLEGNDAFQVLPRANDAIFCWTRAPQSGAASIEYAVVPTGTVPTVATRTLWTAADAASVINGVSGACAPRGDQIMLGTIQWTGNTTLQFESTLVDPATAAASPLGPMVGTQADESPGRFTPAAVDSESWFLYPSLPAAALDQRHQFGLVTVGADNVQHYVTTGLAPTLMNQGVDSTELLAGTGGAWAFVELTGGEAHIGWLARGSDYTAAQLWASPPVPAGSYDAVAPLAVSGNQLAIAYRLESTTWQLFWVTPGGTSSDPTQFGPSTVAMGPQLAEAPQLLRLGGYVDGNQLIVAGASDAQHMTITSVPFGQTTSQQIATFEKLSNVGASRVRIARVGNQYVLGWSERVPGASGTSYTTLDVVMVPVPAGS